MANEQEIGLPPGMHFHLSITGETNNISNGWVPFMWTTAGALLLCTQAYLHGLNRMEPLSLLLDPTCGLPAVTSWNGCYGKLLLNVLASNVGAHVHKYQAHINKLYHEDLRYNFAHERLSVCVEHLRKLWSVTLIALCSWDASYEAGGVIRATIRVSKSPPSSDFSALTKSWWVMTRRTKTIMIINFASFTCCNIKETGEIRYLVLWTPFMNQMHESHWKPTRQ